jgi:membrane protease YdiL (CAAX protease family)
VTEETRPEPAPPGALRSGRQLGALAAWSAIVAIQIALAFSGGDGGGNDDDLLYKWSLVAGAIVIYGLLLVLTYGIATLDPEGPRKALGLQPFAPHMLGAAGGVIVLAIVVGAVLEPILHGGEKQGLAPQEWDSGRAAPLVVNALLSVTLVPLAEELFFRGVGVRVLAVLGSAGAIVGTAVLFSLAHGVVEAIPPLLVFGVGLAWVRVRADSVWPCVIAHGTYNAIAIGATLAI